MKIALSKTESNFFRYTGWLDKFKVNYEILDFDKHDTDLEKINDCNGLILTGGVDIYPELYCDWDTPETKGTYNPKRDGFELKLLEKAIINKIPVLAICRGCQVINVYFRGSLIFDIEKIRNVNHREISPEEGRHHNIKIFPGSLLHELMETDNYIVNSLHHQAVDRLGEGLMINAKSDDGIIEAIEYADKTDKHFLIGVQWHPERFKDINSPASKNILDKFLSECK